MPTVLKEKVKTLENILADFISSTNYSISNLSKEMCEFKEEMRLFRVEMQEFKEEMLEFKDEMKEFKDEMLEFKEEMREFKIEINKKWGDLANKMGTLVEDIVAPSIPRIAKEYFDNSQEIFSAVRVRKISSDRKKIREFDAIYVTDNIFLINDTKSKPKIEYVDDFLKMISEIYEYFPEHKDKKLIPVFSSLYISDDILKYISRKKVFVLGMSDETMQLLNSDLLAA